MKTYVLTISRFFPKTHQRSGEETNFIGQIDAKVKIHTIRSNFELWEKGINEVKKGTAVLSLRYWSVKPYNSKQIEFALLTKNNNLGVQMFMYPNEILDNGSKICSQFEICKNDGLTIQDFKSWFKSYKKDIPMVIIHFTDYRY